MDNCQKCKVWYKSKTIILNIIIALFYALQQAEIMHLLSNELLMIVTIIGNTALRFATNTGITINK